jgi:hypothetical protein
VAVLKPTELSQEVRDADYSRLKAVLAQMKTNLEFSALALDELKREKPKKKATQKRTESELAFDQVRFRELQLRGSIDRASTATPDMAAQAQAQVASDYEAYARAVAAAESVSKSAAE